MWKSNFHIFVCESGCLKTYWLETVHFITYAAKQTLVLSYVQTNATTPNILWSTLLGVVASELAVVCKWVQQLPTIRGPAVHCGKTTLKTLRPCVLRVRDPNNVLRVVCKRIQHYDATLR